MKTLSNRTQKNKSTQTNSNLSKSENRQLNTQIIDNRPEATAQRKLSEMANNSPQAVQLHAVANSYNKVAQMYSPEDDELLQGKFQPIQLLALEEEELLQGKFITAQRRELEDEELLQGKFETIQKKENKTGLPDSLKSGIENQSGISLDDVNVHYNSDKPAQLNAYAYAQGTDIHVAPGQEQHLPHEAWHVVQQKQGRVKPTMQMKSKVNVNDDIALEKEADVMGAKALR